MRRHTARLALIIVLSLLSTLLALAQPYITKYLIDDGLIGGDFPLLVTLSLAMIAVTVASALIGGFNRWHYVDVSARILLSLRLSVYGHLLRLSPRYFAAVRSGDLIARLDGDVAEVQRFAVDSLLASVNGLIALAGALILMLTLSVHLTALALVLIPVIALFLRHMRPRVEALTRAVRERSSDLTSQLVETLGAVKFIQSVSAEAREAARLSTLQDGYRKDTLRLQMTSYITATVPGAITSVSTAVVFIVGGHMAIQGRLSVGTLIAFSAYLVRATGPIHTLLGLYVAAQRARVSLRRVADVRDVPPQVEDTLDSRCATAGMRGAIRFEHVSFAYRADEPVLREVSMALPAGAKVAIQGASGTGKTTLSDLLQRHYDPQEGALYIDDVDLRRIPLAELRRRVAVVAQETVLFSGSIADNVRYAKPDADAEAVADAVERAQVNEFAARLPQGLDTFVGMRGTALSGGQRQRIAIARALLQDPLVLILDEAATGVEPEVEVRIGEAIDELFPKLTRLVITHRPTQLAGFDYTLKFTGGGAVTLSRIGS